MRSSWVTSWTVNYQNCLPELYTPTNIHRRDQYSSHGQMKWTTERRDSALHVLHLYYVWKLVFEQIACPLTIDLHLYLQYGLFFYVNTFHSTPTHEEKWFNSLPPPPVNSGICGTGLFKKGSFSGEKYVGWKWFIGFQRKHASACTHTKKRNVCGKWSAVW